MRNAHDNTATGSRGKLEEAPAPGTLIAAV